MHKLTLLPLALLAACATASAPAAAPPAAPMAMASATLTPGTYSSTIVAADIPTGVADEMRTGLVGAWQIIVHGPTHAVVNVNGREVVSAPFALQGNEIDFAAEDSGEYACHTPGRYTWARSGNTLRFTKIEDGCDGRAAVLTAHPWMM